MPSEIEKKKHLVTLYREVLALISGLEVEETRHDVGNDLSSKLIEYAEKEEGQFHQFWTPQKNKLDQESVSLIPAKQKEESIMQRAHLLKYYNEKKRLIEEMLGNELIAKVQEEYILAR